MSVYIINPNKGPLNTKNTRLGSDLLCFERVHELAQSDGMDMAMVYLNVFVGSGDCFAHVDDADCSPIMPPPEYLSIS